MDSNRNESWHGTTILAVRRAGKVVIAGDGQVSLGATIIKSNARKVRRLGGGNVIGGFAGATADAHLESARRLFSELGLEAELRELVDEPPHASASASTSAVA